jgi:hypothetical protein
MLSSIQQGIQSAHILGEIVNDYKYKSSTATLMVDEFLSVHKTIIVCNGGNNKMLLDLISFLDDTRNPYPVACFHEDDDSLCGALTGVGIILPEEIYDVVKIGPNENYFYSANNCNITYTDSDSFEFQLIERIKSAPLAR